MFSFFFSLQLDVFLLFSLQLEFCACLPLCYRWMITVLACCLHFEVFFGLTARLATQQLRSKGQARILVRGKRVESEHINSLFADYVKGSEMYTCR